ncbi:Urease-like protein, partial [Drosera capensis]
MVIKGGEIAWANMGDPNATISTAEPAALGDGVKEKYGLQKRVEAVSNVRRLTKDDMKLNNALPKIEVNPETYTVKADGMALACAPATSIPLSHY